MVVAEGEHESEPSAAVSLRVTVVSSCLHDDRRERLTSAYSRPGHGETWKLAASSLES